MDTSTTNDDVLVVLQTESGEQIALPMSALPSDFVPGDSGQIIMVESALDEQQEIVVESSEVQSSTENLEDDTLSQNEVHTVQLQTTASTDKPTPRTYSRNNVKSYAPTCGATRIYQQYEVNHTNANLETITTQSVPFDSQAATVNINTTTSTTSTNHPPHKKQKRKETLTTRPLYEEDLELKFQIIEEPPPIIEEAKVERKPRKKYRTKKRIKMDMEKLSKTQSPPKTQPQSPPKTYPHPQPQPQPQSQPQQQPQTERRTRLSNTCRVATGKSYKCNDCEFSTDRINNIILHVKESCPNLKRK